MAAKEDEGGQEDEDASEDEVGGGQREAERVDKEYVEAQWMRLGVCPSPLSPSFSDPNSQLPKLH